MNNKGKANRQTFFKIIIILGGIFVLAQFTDIKFSLLDFLKMIGVGLLSGLFPLIIIVSILGSFRLFRKLYPVQEGSHVETNAQETSKYNNYYWLSTGLIFIGWPIGGVITYYVLVWLSEKWFGLFHGVYIAPIDKAFFGIPAIFLGLLFGALFSTIALKIFVRSEYHNYMNYFSKTWGFNANKAMKLLVYAYFLLIIVLIYFGLSSYTRFSEDGIYIHKPYLLTEEYHTYDEVVKIEEIVRKGKRSSDHVFNIEFSDGSRWRTTSFKDNAVPENFPKIMYYVAEKSGNSYSKIFLDD